MFYCSRCGAPADETKAYCINCGAPLAQSDPAPPEEAGNCPPPVDCGDPCPPKGTRYAPMSIGGYIGFFLLMCIPVANLILLIIWSCGGCKNQNKRNLSRAMLILYVVCVLLAVIFLLILNYAVNGTQIANELQLAALCRSL